MRFSIKALGVSAALALGGTAALGGVAHAGSAGTESLYAPSALVLTVGKGADAATAGVQRAVVLNCAPRPAGTHPAPGPACSEVRSVQGELHRLVGTDTGGRACTRIWDPATVTADGVWEGERISFEHTFANSCALESASGSLFDF